MKRFSTVALLGFGWLFWLLPAVVQAQIKLLPWDPEPPKFEGVVFVPPEKVAEYKHGSLISVTLKNEEAKITGTLVRVDKKARRLFVRTEPGTPPKAIDDKDIKDIRIGVKEIRPAGGQKPNVYQPEIHKLTIRNGIRTSVAYYATTVSPGELTLIEEIEKVENEVARLEHFYERNVAALEGEMAIQGERNKSHELINHLLQQQILDVFSLGRSTNTFNWLNVQHEQGNLLQFFLAMPPNALTKARENLRTALNRAVYEEGRIVAVVLEEPKAKMAPAP